MVSLICSRAGRSTAAAVTLDTVADESRKKMADGVTRSPARLCSRDGKICYYIDALSTIFLLLSLASCFSYFLLPYPGMFIFFVFLRLCSSHSSATLSKYVFYAVRALVSFFSRLISEFLCFYLFFSIFFVVFFSGVAFFVVLSYSVR